MRNPVITLLTDFGTADHYAAAMKGVILGICPKARLIDISHEINPYAIAEGAYTLAQAWRYFPAGTVHLVIVDPGVGGARRPVLAEAGGHRFVAPDNGVLTMAMAEASASRVREITSFRYFRKPVSQTFHGRDIFAPVAAHLASGVVPAKFGKPIDDYVRLESVRPILLADRSWSARILKIDRFGNVISNIDWGNWQRIIQGPFELTIGNGIVSRMAKSYEEIGDREPFLIRGSAGYVEISVNQGSAAEVLEAKADARIWLRLL